MPTDNQSQIQSVLEGLTSVNATAQNNQPANPNNGNPNTVANVNPNVSVLPAQANANGQWWTPPVTSGIDLSGLIGQLQPTTNSNIGNVIGNLTRPPAGPGGPTGPGTPGTPSPGTPTPGAPFTPSPGSGIGRPVGPISGPIANDPHNWEWNFNNAQPNTNLTDGGFGRTGTLDWLRTFDSQYGGIGNTGIPAWDGGGNASSADVDGNPIVDWFRNLGRNIAGEAREQWNEFVSDVTMENGIGGLLSQVARVLIGPGANALVDRATEWINGFRNEEGTISDEDRAEIEAGVLDMLREHQEINWDTTNANIERNMDQLLSRRTGDVQQFYQDYYNSAGEYTPQEWREITESMAWNNFWESDHGGTIENNRGRQHTVGLPSLDLIDDMINNMNRQATDRDRWFQELRGTRYK